MAGNAKLSLIICSKDRATFLGRCLEKIQKDEMESCSAELILVDSASKDRTLALMQNYQRQANFPVNVIHLDQPGKGNLTRDASK